MSRPVCNYELSPSVLRAIATVASCHENFINVHGMRRSQAMSELKAWADRLASVEPEASGLWFNVSTRKIFGRQVVVWGINGPSRPTE